MSDKTAANTMTVVVGILHKMTTRHAVSDLAGIGTHLKALADVVDTIRSRSESTCGVCLQVLDMMIEGGAISDLCLVSDRLEELGNTLGSLETMAGASTPSAPGSKVCNTDLPGVRVRKLYGAAASKAAARIAREQEAAGRPEAVVSATKTSTTLLAEPTPTRQEPAVAPRESVQKDHIVCLEDGKKMKMLKRHLRTIYSLTPDQYRAKWGLPRDYPMVAPDYARQKSRYARSIGLGSNRMRQLVASKREPIEA